MKNEELTTALNELDTLATELDSLSSLVLYLSSALLEVGNEPPEDLLEIPGIELHRLSKGIRENLNAAYEAMKNVSTDNNSEEPKSAERLRRAREKPTA